MKQRAETDNSGTRRLIGAIDAGLRPEPMDPVRAARFRRAVEERLEGSRLRWGAALAAAATAAAAAALWWATPQAPVPAPAEVAARSGAADAEPPTAYAYADPGAYDESLDPVVYLPEEYVVLTNLLALDE